MLDFLDVCLEHLQQFHFFRAQVEKPECIIVSPFGQSIAVAIRNAYVKPHRMRRSSLNP